MGKSKTETAGRLSTGAAARQKTKSTIMIVFGAVFTIIFGIGVIAGIFDFGEGYDLRSGLPVYIGFFIPSAFLLWRGIEARRLLSKAREYESVFVSDRDGIVTLDELAKFTGKEKARIQKDLGRIFNKRWFKDCIYRKGDDPCVLIGGNTVMDTSSEAFVDYRCKNCGGITRIRVGKSDVCSYCGSSIKASEARKS